MRKKTGLKISVIFVSIIFIFTAVLFGVADNTIPLVYSETENSADAGKFSIKDDFRFNGTDGENGFIAANNVSTDKFGSFTYGLIPSENFGSIVDVSNGYIMYSVSIEGNGEFLLVRTLSLKIEYGLFEGYNPKIKVSYSIDEENGEFTDIFISDSDTYGNHIYSEVCFNDVLKTVNLQAEKLYVKISVLHDSATNINVDDVSARLYCAELCGMHNFSMKKGAGLRLSSDYSGDLVFRAFIAKDCYDSLFEKYGSESTIYIGNIILPVDYIKEYDARLETDNVRFEEDGVHVGNYGRPVASTIARNLNGNGDKPYTITVNDVEYYYFDGYISKIQSANVSRDFMSKSYIRIVGRNGKEVLFSLAAFKNQNVKENSRSAVYVSQKLIEKDELLDQRLNTYFIGRITDKHLSTSYIVRKFYVDNDYNIINTSESIYETKINEKIVLTDEQKASDFTEFIYIGDNGEIKSGDTVIYSNSVYDRAYPLNKLIINLYYKGI